MSHETIGAEGRLVYMMPALPSDVLRHRQFQHFFRDYRGASFSVQTRDGWYWGSSSAAKPAFTATFPGRGELDAVINDSTEASLSGMFLDGKLDIQGDLLVLLSVAEYVLRHSSGLSRGLIGTIRRASLDWMKKLGKHRNSPVTGWQFDTSLFDLSVDLCEPWLGTSLGHFCGRFRSPKESLEHAQQHALRQICSALKLVEHDRLLDMNCGWGSVLIYAVAEYGVNGQGIAFSQQQAATITDRLRQRALHGKCAVECRTSAEPVRIERTFEKIVDIGLFDQTANFSFRSFLEEASRILSSRGMLLMHRATRCPRMSGKGAEASHLESPGSAPLPLLSGELQVAESLGYQILNVEDLSEDYRVTLRHWIERLGCYTALQDGIANCQFRSWLFRLLDTAAKVDVGEVQLEQILLRRQSHC